MILIYFVSPACLPLALTETKDTQFDIPAPLEHVKTHKDEWLQEMKLFWKHNR